MDKIKRLMGRVWSLDQRGEKKERKKKSNPHLHKPPTEKAERNTHTHKHTQGLKHFCEITYGACEVEYIITVYSLLGWNV